MSFKDPISDLITRIRNASLVKHQFCVVPLSRLKLDIVKVLFNEGYVLGYEVQDDGLVKKNIRIKLKYDQEGNAVISSIRRISKSSKRLYVRKRGIPRVLNGLGITILSTSSGVMTGKEARMNNVGGELVVEVF